jgi:hypothetical protein
MSECMTDAEKYRVAVGFVLVAGLFAWAVWNIALHIVARRMERKSK